MLVKCLLQIITSISSTKFPKVSTSLYPVAQIAPDLQKFTINSFAFTPHSIVSMMQLGQFATTNAALQPVLKKLIGSLYPNLSMNAD
jgi:hypothetical protein